MRSLRFAVPALAATMLLGAAAVQAQYGTPPPPPQGYAPGYGQGGWDAPPPQFAGAWRRGFHDGVEGARRDFDNHRPPNPNNRDEFRNPHFIAPPDRHDYREGFRRGYAVAVRHIYGRGYENWGPR